MRRLVVVVIVLLATSAICFAQGASPTASCTLAGSWYGGMPDAGSPYYHATITPSSGGRFSGMFQANFVYGQPFLTVTHWTGEVSKTGPQTFHGYFMSMAEFDPLTPLPPPPGLNLYLPEMDFISYKIELLDCNTFRGTLDVWYTYYNFTNDIKPLIDAPLPPGSVSIVDPPIVEVYHRVPDACTACPSPASTMSRTTASPAWKLGRSPQKK